MTRIENVDAPFAPDKAVRFCPGVSGGSEWNGPAYDPDTNLIITGEIDWCTTVKRQTDEQLGIRRRRPVRDGDQKPVHLVRQDGARWR